MALAGAEKTKTITFFIFSQILIILALYSLYDEAVVRRPWKHFQNEFNRLELQVAELNYNKIYKKFVDEGTDKKIKQLKLELENATTAKESKEYKKISSKLDEMQIIFDDKELDIKFNKSIVDAYYYEYRHAELMGHDFEQEKKKYDELTAKIESQNKDLKSFKKELNVQKKKIKEYDDKIVSLQEKIAELEKPLKDAQDKIDNISTKVASISQVVINDLGVQGNIYWGKVDRCQTCHITSDKKGYEDVVNAFNLTVVKDEKALKDLLQKSPDKKGLVITEQQKMHYQIMYGTHPRRDVLLGSHPVQEYGCTSCHGGEGRALQIKGLSFENEDHKKDQKVNEEEILGSSSGYVQGVFGHEDKVHATNHHGIEPLLRGNQMESNCLNCHMGEIYVPEAKKLTQGLNLFVDLGCHGCHLVKGYDELFKVGPELNKVASKVDKLWLVDWIKNPKHYMPNSRMPMFGLSDDEAVAVASFLISNSQEHHLKYELALSGDVDKGKELFESVGCLGCHSADSNDETYAIRSRAPNLSRIASKVNSASWIYDWIKNPKNYSEHTRMPSLRLTDQEAANITAYLMSLNSDYHKSIEQRSGNLASLINPTDKDLLQKGKTVITKRGCYACHSIRGFEGLDRIGPELNGLALKENFELDFGDALRDDYTFKDVFGHNVYVGHSPERPGESTEKILARVKVPETSDQAANLVENWQSWVRNKIKYPMSIYMHPRAQLLMPNFNLSPDEMDALLAFLKGMQKREVPLRYQVAKAPYMYSVIQGQQLLAKYNCIGCHNIWDFGGDINAKIDKKKGAKLTQFYPPSLDHVGEKIRPEWLHEFLKNPFVYRPQVQVRMPTFGFDENEINQLIQMFAGISKVPYELTNTNYVLSHKNIDVAKVLASPEAFNCFSCHFENGKAPGNDPANWAPDWAMMRARLQYDFITKWIKNPVKYQKFAVMPGFLNSDDEAHPDYFDGKADKQLEALRDYILSLGAGE